MLCLVELSLKKYYLGALGYCEFGKAYLAYANIVQTFMEMLIYHENIFHKQTKCNTVFLISVEDIGCGLS